MLDQLLSKKGRLVAGAAMLALGGLAGWATFSRAGPAAWLIERQVDLLGAYSEKLTFVLLLVPALLVGSAVGFLFDRVTGQGGPRKVRIIAVPPGEAPEDVRRCWVGLELPLAAGESGPRPANSFGVLSGPRTPSESLARVAGGESRRQYGYVIDARTAVDILARHAPEAAAWWEREAPHCLQPGRKFLFHAEVCEEV